MYVSPVPVNGKDYPTACTVAQKQPRKQALQEDAADPKASQVNIICELNVYLLFTHSLSFARRPRSILEVIIGGLYFKELYIR